MRINIFKGNKSFDIDKNDTVIIIDVLRAGTTAQIALESNINSLTFAKNEEEAFAYRNSRDNVILVGEKKGIKINNFDYGNSPNELINANIKNKNIVQLTSNGVKAINNNWTTKTYFCGFCNADSVVNAIKRDDTINISLVASDPNSDDDIACAEYIESKLTGKAVSTQDIIDRIYKSKAAAKFLSDDDRFPQIDLQIATKLRESKFAISVIEKNKVLMAIKNFTKKN